jgi:NAD+ kinase
MSSELLPPVARIGIVAKAQLHAAVPHLVEIGAWLADRQVEAIFETATGAMMPAEAKPKTADRATLAAGVDMVLVLGGDGTLLGMADSIGEAGSGIPILGVNFGSLGFLTEVTLPELYPSLEAAIRGRARVENRMTLECTTMREDHVLAKQIALNDAVVTKGARSRMIDVSVWVGDEFVTRVKADGLIVATPTGSTAYNLAAGGPIVLPLVDALILTPIAPHTLTNRPVVIPGAAAVRVQPALEDRDEVFVTFDGQAGLQLKNGDTITIVKSSARLRLVKPSTRGYFEVLRTKLKWGER